MFKRLRELFRPPFSATASFETKQIAEAKAIVRARGFSYCLYMQGFAINDKPDYEFDVAANRLMRNGYLLAHPNGHLVGTLGPLNDEFPRQRPKLVVSN